MMTIEMIAAAISQALLDLGFEDVTGTEKCRITAEYEDDDGYFVLGVAITDIGKWTGGMKDRHGLN